MAEHAAFLRGINVGGRRVKMDDLQQAFKSLGFADVTTYIASGNVVFATRGQSATALRTRIEQTLRNRFGFDAGVIVRTIGDLQALVHRRPFRQVRITPKTKLYVTFLAHKPQTALKTPYRSPDKDFAIVSVSDREICSAVTLSPDTGTPDLMTFLEKQFGKDITTRNWATILKLVEGHKAEAIG
ncbi:MAG TPA: DUF1697 domain-containing protein [bacterium]|nr:DUF1697 domain-containing protein [bacterium]